jgi:DNA polymerase
MRKDDKILKDLKEVVSLTRQYLEQEKGRGLREVAVSPRTRLSKPKLALQKKTLENLRGEVEQCQGCLLSKTRNNVVFGEGSPNAKLMLVGEAPGRNEDLQGEPFVGQAGQLLTKILASIDFKREEVFIGNILKCRPPMNRNPKPEEIKACWGYLDKQLTIIKPKIIVALGTFAAQALLKTDERIGRLRGKFYPLSNGVELLATYHPAALLRNPGYKRAVWEDMKLLRKKYQGL